MKAFATNALIDVTASLAAAASPPPHWSIYIAPVIAAVAALVAWRALINTRSIARQKATLDLIEKVESSEHYRARTNRFSELRKSLGFIHLNDPVGDDVTDRRMLIDYLNHYELVSIGIRQNILDDDIYRAWIEGSFVRDWNAAASWVQRERWKHSPDDGWQYRKSIYANFQEVACRWSRDAIRLSAASSSPPSTSHGEGDTTLPKPVDEVLLKS